jgi:hypothetical protein
MYLRNVCIYVTGLSGVMIHKTTIKIFYPDDGGSIFPETLVFVYQIKRCHNHNTNLLLP